MSGSFLAILKSVGSDKHTDSEDGEKDVNAWDNVAGAAGVSSSADGNLLGSGDSGPKFDGAARGGGGRGPGSTTEGGPGEHRPDTHI
ncbi:hypothetical protein F4V91_32295 [Neorhizobium galegae]|uniref:Uncharacterized protein n=1 Tax=Neorhizobium galegae TaxID=399 RepID=A0A6A1TG55_NEOGA|nr:hypothetical protein [Neorhizobium galegae]KAB1082624.1 hypothetical protein F4V91_32295 [Neorhizobium galegae]